MGSKYSSERVYDGLDTSKLFTHQPISCYFCDPADVRVRKESVLIAALLIEKKFKNISFLMKKVEERLFHFSSKKEVDNFFYNHVFEALSLIQGSKKLQKKILQLGVPIFNPWSEKITRTALRLSKREKITSAHIQTLMLSAFLHPLRQNVGSCFATAPAILIQKQQPLQFFADLEDLLNTGILKRTFSGQEHAVPISTSWGPGIMNKVVWVDKENLFKSSELMHCIKALNLLGSKELKGGEDLLRKLLDNKVENGQKISLYEIMRLLLLSHFKIQEKDVLKSSSNNTSSFALEMQGQKFVQKSKQSQFQEALFEAQYQLISYHEHPLLKTWEYTFASFAETESQFYKWNLYTSLGFDSKKEGSIARCIYEYIEEKLKSYEEKIKHHDKEYEQEYYRVKMLEKRVVDTESEHTANWARVEFQNHLNEFNFHRKMRDSFIDKSERVSKLLSKILKTYDQLFPQYFQEVYDASMQEVSQDIFEDSPAGFRLIYKHGRQDPSLWSFVKSKEDFIRYLKEFFVNTEFEIASQEEIEEFKEEYAEIITALIGLVHSENFIISAFKRISERYQLPFPSKNLSRLDEWPYKPWSYISGGSMEHLLNHYYKKEGSFTKEEQKVATSVELFSFLIEATRTLLPDQIEALGKQKENSLLMYSPNHAFLFKPGLLPLHEIWDTRDYSFSWVRDHFIHPRLRFIESIRLSPLEVSHFLDLYLSKDSYFNLWLKENIEWPSYAISIKDFRDLLTRCLKKVPHHLKKCSPSLEELDSWFYQCYPLTPAQELSQTCFRCIEELFSEDSVRKKAHFVTQEVLGYYQNVTFFQPVELYEVLKVIVSLTIEKASSHTNWPSHILDALQKEGLMMPKAFVFADTNWPYFYFAFAINPATENLELWRMNPLLYKGYPMHQWKHYFSEEKPSLWGVLTRYNEYLLEKDL